MQSLHLGIAVGSSYRVLFLASWYPHRGGPTLGNFVERHAHAVAKGHEVEVFYLVTEAHLKAPELVSTTNGALTEHRLYLPKSASRLRHIQWMAAHVRGLWGDGSLPFDLVHLHVVHPAGWQALWFQRKFGLPYVITEHWTGYHNGRFEQLPSWQQWLARRTAKKAACVCPVSDHLGKAMREHGLEGRYQPVGNVVDTELFLPVSTVNQPQKLLHVSHLGDDHKNISGLLRGFKAALEQGVELTLDVVGDGDIRPHQATAQSLGLNGAQVTFTGEQTLDQIASRMGKADGFVLFSNFENLPCVMLEAWSAGKPVIATDVGGISEHLSPERGWLIPKGDEAALADAFQAFQSHAISSQALREYAEAHFSEQAVCRAFTEVYQSVVS